MSNLNVLTVVHVIDDHFITTRHFLYGYNMLNYCIYLKKIYGK